MFTCKMRNPSFHSGKQAAMILNSPAISHVLPSNVRQSPDKQRALRRAR